MRLLAALSLALFLSAIKSSSQGQVYTRVTDGSTCERVTSMADCEEASEELGLPDNVVLKETASGYPPYCYFFDNGIGDYGLWFNDNGNSASNCTTESACICKNDKYFLAEKHQKCDEACDKKGLTCNNEMLEEAAADYDTCNSIITSLEGVQVKGGGLTMSIIAYDGLKGDSAGCTWHPSNNNEGSVQLLTKGNDKPTCDGDIRSGTTRRRVCACQP